jgi:hypothetical protein
MAGPYTASDHTAPDRSKLAAVRGVLSLAAAAAVAAVPGTAGAGVTPYGWLYGTDVIPERGAEIQTWIAEENGKASSAARRDTALLWDAVVGITDRLELALPIELLWREGDGEAPELSLRRYGAEARYRFVSQDPVEASPLAPLVRVAVKRDVTVRDRMRAEADVVASYRAGRVHALVDLGVTGDIGRDSHFELHPGAGVSIEIAHGLRLGAEAYAELSFDDETASWAAVGPNLAWTHGRFWLAAAFGIGVYQIDTAPRVVWGILF